MVHKKQHWVHGGANAPSPSSFLLRLLSAATAAVVVLQDLPSAGAQASCDDAKFNYSSCMLVQGSSDFSKCLSCVTAGLQNDHVLTGLSCGDATDSACHLLQHTNCSHSCLYQDVCANETSAWISCLAETAVPNCTIRCDAGASDDGDGGGGNGPSSAGAAPAFAVSGWSSAAAAAVAAAFSLLVGGLPGGLALG